VGLDAQVPSIDALALDAAANALFEAVADVDPEDLDALPALSVGDAIFDLGDVRCVSPGLFHTQPRRSRLASAAATMRSSCARWR
jgi:hypothetical protein